MKTNSNYISSKLPQIGTSIFAVMSQLANEHKAINLSQGFPDFNCSEKLQELVNQSIKKGYNQYAPMPGIMPLREAIAEKTHTCFNVSYNPETEITVTAGATQAIYTAISAFIKEGDEVIVFEPAYDCYVPAILMNGGTPKYGKLNFLDYSINWDETRKLISQRTRMIIINSPHNPTGSVLSEEDLKQLEKITENTNILILSDEVYEHIIFDHKIHQGVCRYPNLKKKSLIISSFGKTFHTTGWKMGYVLAPEELMAEFRKIHQFIVFGVNTPIQYAVAEFMKDPENYIHLPNFYQQKRDYFCNILKNSRFNIAPSKGTYFQLLDYSRISDEKEEDFAVRLTKEFKVASIPVSVFYHKKTENTVLRFCFAKSEETMNKAAEILCKI
ncbi:MAG TPA: methionine aminotransferase [Bacteroidales bacterium]|nr:methionine aminotransferase [Bacteroidales bacterium]